MIFSEKKNKLCFSNLTNLNFRKNKKKSQSNIKKFFSSFIFKYRSIKLRYIHCIFLQIDRYQCLHSIIYLFSVLFYLFQFHWPTPVSLNSQNFPFFVVIKWKSLVNLDITCTDDTECGGIGALCTGSKCQCETPWYTPCNTTQCSKYFKSW